jgi:NTE family protein
MKNNKKIGLSLSGGGFRATAYHIGTLKKLNDMNILKDVDIISSVSGGSITSAYYGLFGKNFNEFENGLIKKVHLSIIKGIILSPRFILISLIIISLVLFMCVLLFTSYAWSSFALLIIILILFFNNQFKLLPLSKIIEYLYNRHFFEGKVLNDLQDNPIIAINSTNLETGRPFTFSKNKMSDSSYFYPQDKGKSITFNSSLFPIARAVAASTCVPFAFTPIKINKQFFDNSNDFKRVKPRLVDGGVYDNQGIHKITQKGSSYECDIIITSDAGNIFPYQNNYRNTIELLVRTSDIFMNRIKNFQMIRNIYEKSQIDEKEIAYHSLGWNIENCIQGFIDNLKTGNISESIINAHRITKEEIATLKWDTIKEKLEKNVNYKKIISESPTPRELKLARSVKTSLKALRDDEIYSLIKQAYCLTELQIRLYCPTLI